MNRLVEIRCYCNPKKKKGYLIGKVAKDTPYALKCHKCKKIKTNY